MENSIVNIPYNPDWIHRKVTGMTALEEIETIKERMEHNRKLPIGRVVFYIAKRGFHWEVKWGVIADIYNHTVVLDMYDVFERRLINGIPYNDFEPDAKYKKLPKGWNYSTRLFTCENAEIPAEMVTALRKMSIQNAQNIQKAIDVGYFVPVRTIDYSHIDVEYEKDKGFRLIKTTYPYEYHPSSVCFMLEEIYENYDDAQKLVDQHKEEMHIEAEMSDLEWSIYEIDHNLARACALSEEGRIKCHDFLLSLDNVEEIETRNHGGYIQWKYSYNKKWISIDPNVYSLYNGE